MSLNAIETKLMGLLENNKSSSVSLNAPKFIEKHHKVLKKTGYVAIVLGVLGGILFGAASFLVYIAKIVEFVGLITVGMNPAWLMIGAGVALVVIVGIILLVVGCKGVKHDALRGGMLKSSLEGMQQQAADAKREGHTAISRGLFKLLALDNIKRTDELQLLKNLMLDIKKLESGLWVRYDLMEKALKKCSKTSKEYSKLLKKRKALKGRLSDMRKSVKNIPNLLMKEEQVGITWVNVIKSRLQYLTTHYSVPSQGKKERINSLVSDDDMSHKKLKEYLKCNKNASSAYKKIVRCIVSGNDGLIVYRGTKRGPKNIVGTGGFRQNSGYKNKKGFNLTNALKKNLNTVVKFLAQNSGSAGVSTSKNRNTAEFYSIKDGGIGYCYKITGIGKNPRHYAIDTAKGDNGLDMDNLSKVNVAGAIEDWRIMLVGYGTADQWYSCANAKRLWKKGENLFGP